LAQPSDDLADRPFSLRDTFSAAAQWTSRQCGRASTFAFACATVLAWAITGPYFHYSDTWQLVINTGTTIVTFLMVFLIQNSQNRDTAALHLKLDELIRVTESARNKLLDLDNMTEQELDRLKTGFASLANSVPDSATLHEAVDGLETADAEIQAAKAKVSAIAEERR
jgi:low affinity Fe/Cu permease